MAEVSMLSRAATTPTSNILSLHLNYKSNLGLSYSYFDVSPDHLSGALDRFSQFFVCPLFTESATDREVNAVNSEHEKNIPNDTWRINQIEKAIANPSHDFSKFGTGNIQTLDVIPKVGRFF